MAVHGQFNMSPPIRVLFTHYGDEWIRGSEILLLDLLRALDKNIVYPVVWCNSHAMAEATKAAGYSTIQGEFQYLLDYDSPRPSLQRFRGLVRTCRMLCREYGIQVLHANSAAPTQWLVPAGFSARLPVLSHLHIDYLRRSRYVLLLHAATLVVGVSRYVNEGLIADGMRPERIRVIYNGIDFRRLDHSPTNLRAKLGIPGDAFVVTTAGSLIARKGHDVLIRAFYRMSAGPRAHLLIQGDGPEREALKKLATSLDIAGCVHFLDHVDDVASLYRAADVFALASRGDSFGLVLAEAGHFGLPSVSTCVGGISEVIAHETTGILVPPDDVNAFSDALQRLMNDVVTRVRMGGAAATRVGHLFTAARMARQFEETYATLAAIPPQQLGWSRMIRDFRPYAKLLAAAKRPERERYKS